MHRSSGGRSANRPRPGRPLTPTGTLVPNGGAFDHRWVAGGGRVVHAKLLSLVVKQELRPFLLRRRHVDLEALRDLLEAGDITPVIDRVYPLSETPQAIEHMGTGHARGKIAIAV